MSSKRKGKPLSAKLVSWWHPTLNGDLRPEDVSGGSERVVWWRHYDRSRKEWHEWPATPMAMSRTGMCMICTGRYLAVGINDLKTRNLKVAAMWHPTLNGELTPQTFTEHAPEKVWWRHKDKRTALWHEWPARIGHLTKKKPNKCAICSGQRIQIGVNDLVTTHPELASQWHPTKNGTLTPQMVTRGNKTHIWWQKECMGDGVLHIWHAAVNKRTGKIPRGCAVCRGYQVQRGVNDLASQYPELVREWDKVKNKNIRPNSITAGSGLKVFWRHYDKSTKTWHSWPARIADRAMTRQRNCPDCSKSGFDPAQPGCVYVLSGTINKIKVIQFGISNDSQTRLADHARSGFTNSPVTLVPFHKGINARALENRLLDLMKEYDISSCSKKGIKFDGSTESFCLDDTDDDFLEDFKELVRLQ